MYILRTICLMLLAILAVTLDVTIWLLMVPREGVMVLANWINKDIQDDMWQGVTLHHASCNNWQHVLDTCGHMRTLWHLTWNMDMWYIAGTLSAVNVEYTFVSVWSTPQDGTSCGVFCIYPKQMHKLIQPPVQGVTVLIIVAVPPWPIC